MSVRHRVETLMRLDTKYRDSDSELILKIWSDEGFKLTRQQKYMFMGLPSAEVITRRRREFSGQYPASERITEHRYKHFKKYSEEFTKKTYYYRIIKKGTPVPKLFNRLRRKHV